MENVVLAIDDEPAFLDIIQKVARSVGFTTTATTDPEVFRASLQTQAPSVVFLDLQMPGSDGIQLLHALADAKSRATVVVMSGFDARVLGMAHSIGLGLGLEMAQPLQKPIRPALLRELLVLRGKKSPQIDAAALRLAIEHDQLELVYHPLVRLDTGRALGFEALVRWRHPEYGMIMPDKFIAMAERENIIGALTERVLDLAAQQIAAWKAVGIDQFVSVNLSAVDIVPELPETLLALCTRYNIEPGQLRLELTETAAMGNHALTVEVLTRVRLKGFRLAIDDFGTGYSSLVQLYRLPFTELKIDQSFVRAMTSSDEANIIVGAIVSLGNSLHLDLVAEGVETEALLKRLIALGCQVGQGYLFSRPMPANQVAAWLTNNAAGAPTF